MTVGAPDDLGPGAELERLLHDVALAVAVQKRENFANVSVDVGVHGGQVGHFPRPGVATMKEDDGNSGVLADEGL